MAEQVLTADSDAVDVWADVIGQPEAVSSLRAAVANPVHAYLFLGPPGTGKKAAAGVFAGELLAAADPDHAERHRTLATRFAHPDLQVVTPTGSEFRIGDSKRLVVEASRSPVEGRRKIVMAERFHDANANAMPVLLKVAEEPPATTIFVFLADHLRPEQVTVASRCTTIEFRDIPHHVIAAALVADGIDPAAAERSAEGSGGSLRRARLLSTDERLQIRRDAWWSIPDRLDGTGAAVAVIVEELRTMIDDSMAPLKKIHAAELEALAEREERYGTRGSGRKDLEAHHKRVERKHRADELVFGFATLSRRYSAGLATADDAATGRIADAHARITRSSSMLSRSPMEMIFLQSLLLDMPQR